MRTDDPWFWFERLPLLTQLCAQVMHGFGIWYQKASVAQTVFTDDTPVWGGDQ
jgi:hypothetical protein